MIASIAQKLRLPSICVLCYQYHQEQYAVCQSCYSLLKRVEHACCHCALPLPNEQFLICGRCIKEKPAFDQIITAYLFEEPLRTLMHQYKYQEALYLRTFFVRLILDALSDHIIQTQCLVPVPLHAKRLQQRGFNQTAELTKLLAKHLNIPYELTLCKKIAHTESQMNLSGYERRQNLHGAFQIKSSSYQHITLVDDLLTTGSTVNELARLFKRQGVARVDVWCCARTNRVDHEK